MEITKYSQSCVLLQTENVRILIDPGSINYSENLLQDEWSMIDIILVTHKHGDHIVPTAINELLSEGTARFYTSHEVAKTYPELNPIVVKEGDTIEEINDITIDVVKAVHGYIPPLRGDKEIHENIGFIVDDGETRAYHTSDTISFKNDYSCDVIFVPVCNHGLVMGPYEAALFSQACDAEMAIPIHYDNPKYPVSLQKVEETFNDIGVSIKVLGEQETVELDL